MGTYQARRGGFLADHEIRCHDEHGGREGEVGNGDGEGRQLDGGLIEEQRDETQRGGHEAAEHKDLVVEQSGVGLRERALQADGGLGV